MAWMTFLVIALGSVALIVPSIRATVLNVLAGLFYGLYAAIAFVFGAAPA